MVELHDCTSENLGRLLEAWKAWDERPSILETCINFEEALKAISSTPSKLRTLLAAERRAGVSHAEAVVRVTLGEDEEDTQG